MMTRMTFGRFCLSLCALLVSGTAVATELTDLQAEYARYHREITGRDPSPQAVTFGIDPKLSVSGNDAYSIVSRDAGVAITASNLRSAWYGLYDFLSRRGGCRWYWDGDVVPKRESIDFSGLDVREESRFEYRAIRYFAHRGLTRFQAEHWGFEDWKRELAWCLKRRLNVVMLRLGDEDAFQRAFPDVVPYPDPLRPLEMTGYNNRAPFWPLEYRGDLRRKVRARAYELGLMMPEDFGTMTHWYSRTPRAFLEKMKPPFLPQEAGNYREDTGRVWDVREPKWLDAYFRITEAQVADGAKPELLHTIGLGERRAFTNRADNLALKIDVIHRLVDGARRRWPDAKVLLAGWDFFGTWHSDEVRQLFETLDPSHVLLWDYEGDSPLRRYGNVTEWGVKGRFPYTYGLFINSAAGYDIRTDYDFCERRGRELVADPFCRGFVLWPEASHIDTFMLEWFVENAWSPFVDRPTLLGRFCRGRYGRSAGEMESAWRRTLSMPLASYCCWGGNLANRAPSDVVSFTEALNNPDAIGWASARELPAFAAVPAVLRDLAKVGLDDPFVCRDAVDIARTLSDRLILRTRAELVSAFAKWRQKGEGATRLGALARAYAALGAHFADLLEQHTDYSLGDSLRRLAAVRPIVRPDFARVLLDNATCSYCRSHHAESARRWYAPCMRDLADAVLSKLAACDRTPLDVRALGKTDYRSRMLADPEAALAAPAEPRTPENLRRTLQALADDAAVVLAEPPAAGPRPVPGWAADLRRALAGDESDVGRFLRAALGEDVPSEGWVQDPFFAKALFVPRANDRADAVVSFELRDAVLGSVLVVANRSDWALDVGVKGIDVRTLVPFAGRRYRTEKGGKLHLDAHGFFAADLRHPF